MLRQRLVFGTLMIAALAGVVVLDAWLSIGLEWQSPGRTGGPGSDPAETSLNLSSVSPQVAGGAAPGWQTPPSSTGGRPDVPLRCGFVLTMLVAVLAVAGAYELGRLCAAGGCQPARHWAAFVTLALVCTPWLHALIRLDVLTCPAAVSGSALLVLVLALGFLGTCVGILSRGTTQGALAAMAVTLFVIFYVGLLAASAMGIRFLRPGPAGAAALVYFILTVKFGDIGAFFVGSAIGRRKLAPWLSPNKTWEGAGGAVLGSVLMAELGLLLWTRLPILGSAPLSAVQAIVFGSLMAVFGHAGDLVESAIKRSVGAKDSGRAIPGFGGLLDLLDSPLFAAPIAWGFLTFCSAFS